MIRRIDHVAIAVRDLELIDSLNADGSSTSPKTMQPSYKEEGGVKCER